MDVDEFVVDQILSGVSMPTTTGERAILVDEFTARGWTAKRIGMRLGITERTVVRYRSRRWREESIAA